MDNNENRSDVQSEDGANERKEPDQEPNENQS